MDIRTGKTYNTREDALKDGVPDSDIAEVVLPCRGSVHVPIVKFSSGPFKDRTYKRTAVGQLVRVDE